jgi:anti-anti-sigma factor
MAYGQLVAKQKILCALAKNNRREFGVGCGTRGNEFCRWARTSPCCPFREATLVFSVDLDVRECEDHVLIVLRGELDMADAADVAAALTAAAADRSKIIVDLSGLAFIDCSGAGVLMRAQRQAREAGGSLLLAAPQPRVTRVFELSRLIDSVSFHASVEQATGLGDGFGLSVGPRPGLVLRRQLVRSELVRSELC